MAQVAKFIEVSASSNKSFEDAIAGGLKKVSTSVKNIKGAWINEQKVVCGPDGTQLLKYKSGANYLPYQLPRCLQFVYADLSADELASASPVPFLARFRPGDRNDPGPVGGARLSELLSRLCSSCRSRTSGGRAAQSMGSRRGSGEGPCWWIVRPIIRFPVPDSPTIRTGTGAATAARIWSSRRRWEGPRPTRFSNSSCASSAR